MGKILDAKYVASFIIICTAMNNATSLKEI